MTICRVCQRKLTNLTSVKRELGRVCYRKWKAGYRGVQVKPFEDVKKIERMLVRSKK